MTLDQYVRAAEADLPTETEGVTSFRMVAYRRTNPKDELIALVYGSPKPGMPALVRLHSACLTGEAFGSLKCDCGPQLRTAMRCVREYGWGAVVYLTEHEGRGIGLINKVRAYGLQDDGADTIEANERLGLAVDARQYHGAAFALKDLGMHRVQVLTNNPLKIAALRDAGIEVVERVPIWTGSNEHNQSYLAVKRDRMGHLRSGGRAGR